ncbi:MAG: HAD family hydrolase [Gaiellales bacterium]
MTRYQAVLFDAFGTLFELDDPFGRLHRAVRDRLGLDRDGADVEAAFLAEASHFAAHCHEAVDAPSLRALQLDCADIVVERLSLPVTPEAAVATLGDSIAYRRFDDVAPTLAELERRSVRAAVVSNWDYSLDEVLSGLGLAFDVVVTSAATGASKPDPAPFRVALERLGLAPGQALHVGDTPEADGDGARAAGIDVRIIDRDSWRPGTIARLTEVASLL